MSIPGWIRVVLTLALILTALPSPVAAQKATVPLGTGARFLPPDTAAYFAVDVDPRSPQRQQLERIIAYYVRAGSVAELEQMALDAAPDAEARALLAGLDTWIGGELFFGLTDPSGLRDLLSSTLNTGAPGMLPMEPPSSSVVMPQAENLWSGFLVGVAIGDRVAFRRWIERAHQHMEAGHVDTATERYRGVDILAIRDRSFAAYVAMYEDYVLFAPDQNTLASAIDRTSATSLAGTASFRNAFATFPNRPLVFAYAGDLWDDLEISSLPFYTGMATPPVSWMAGVIRLDTQSVRLDATTVFDLTRITPGLAASLNQRANPLRTATIVPSGSFAYVGLDNLKQVWDQLLEMGGPIADELPGMLIEIRAATGIDLQEDLFSWLTGETALFVAPSGVEDDLQGFGVGLVIEARDPAAAAERLHRIMAGIQRIAYQDRELETVDVLNASFDRATLTPDTALYGGVVGNWAIIATSPVNVGEAMMGMAIPGGLTTQSNYLRARTALPGQVQSLLYVDVPALADAVMDAIRIGPRDRAEAAYYLRPLGGLAASSSISGNRSNGNVYLQLVLP
jgi:hypothetical protein